MRFYFAILTDSVMSRDGLEKKWRPKASKLNMLLMKSLIKSTTNKAKCLS